MKAKPVKSYRMPAYPTRLEVLNHPEVLEKQMPPAWLRNAELAGTVAVFLAANLGVNAPLPKKMTPQKAAIVAPIFVHGEGRGVSGCLVAAPPVFLSEEDALQIISEELSKAGMDVSNKNATMTDIKIPGRQRFSERTVPKEKGSPGWKTWIEVQPKDSRSLKTDIFDTTHTVAVEYISQNNYYQSGGPYNSSTVHDYDFKEAAENVSKEVVKQGKGIYFGAFYDPMPDTGWKDTEREKDWNKREAMAKAKAGAEAKKLLREQVKDFVDWLKGQGAI